MVFYRAKKLQLLLKTLENTLKTLFNVFKIINMYMCFVKITVVFTNFNKYYKDTLFVKFIKI